MKKISLKSKIILSFLAFCMAVGLLPLTAFAQTPMAVSTTETRGDFTITGDTSNYTWDDTNKVLTITGSGALTIANTIPVTTSSMGSKHTIVVQSGTTANLTLNNVYIVVGDAKVGCAFEVQNTATANITLQGENWLASGMGEAGLKVQSGATLLITEASTGELRAYGQEGDGYSGITSDKSGAGIGGSMDSAGGNITIAGGTIYAQGGMNSAGIGGGNGGAGGAITITGGTVNTTGNVVGAGIGGGSDGAGGDITITGGTVTASGGSSKLGTGIGGGGNGAGGNITITGGTVTATGAAGAAGIGGKIGDTTGVINISGGMVTATGGKGYDNNGITMPNPNNPPRAGIDMGTIKITGGIIAATGGDYNDGINVIQADAFTVRPTITVQEQSKFNSVEILAGDNGANATSRVLADTYYEEIFSKITIEELVPAINLGAQLTYNGAQQTQFVTSVKLGTYTLPNTLYTVSGNTATNAGDHTVTTTINLGANGVYENTTSKNYIGGGTQTATYTIQKATITITGATAQSRAYDGTTTATADVSFGGLANGGGLVNGTDYTVNATFSSPDVGDNLTVTGVVQLTQTVAANNYIFSNAEFSLPTAASITPLALAGAQVTLGTPLVENGTQQTQSVALINHGRLILTEGTDYTLSGNTATYAGSYTLTVTGTGNYNGALAVPFTVVNSTTLPYEPTGTLDIPNSTVPQGNTLHVNQQTEAEKQQDLAKLNDYAKQNGITGVVNFLEDITMKDANGNEVQPQNGNTRIRINVPGLTTADTVTVLHLKDDGTVEEIRPVDVYNGYVEFNAPSFSVYSVIVQKASTGTTTSISPQTGAHNSGVSAQLNVLPVVSLTLIAVCGMVLVFQKKRLEARKK